MEHKGLPVAGYQTQTDDRVALVNRNKEIEERVLRIVDELMKVEDIDLLWLINGRDLIEQGFMCVNRSVFQPARVRLPDDDIELPSDAVGEDEDLSHEEFKRRKIIVDAPDKDLIRELRRRQVDVHQYSEGICDDGVAILKDGVPMPISEIVAALQGKSRP